MVMSREEKSDEGKRILLTRPNEPKTWEFPLYYSLRSKPRPLFIEARPGQPGRVAFWSVSGNGAAVVATALGWLPSVAGAAAPGPCSVFGRPGPGGRSGNSAVVPSAKGARASPLPVSVSNNTSFLPRNQHQPLPPVHQPRSTTQKHPLSVLPALLFPLSLPCLFPLAIAVVCIAAHVLVASLFPSSPSLCHLAKSTCRPSASRASERLLFFSQPLLVTNQQHHATPRRCNPRNAL